MSDPQRLRPVLAGPATPQHRGPGAAPVAAPAVDRGQALLSVVAEKTGYPLEMLGMGMALETDLGVDSIKDWVKSRRRPVQPPPPPEVAPEEQPPPPAPGRTRQQRPPHKVHSL